MPAYSLGFSNLFQPASQSQWLSSLLSALQTLGVPATSWQSGSVAKQMLTLFSYLGSAEDGLVSVAAQGGFLDFAGSGTVTYNALSGQVVTIPVTPDPSTLTGTALAAWQPGWLDVLADGSYNVQRLTAASASGSVAITNTSGSAAGPFAAGTFHVANPTTGATYTNTATFSVPSAQVAGGSISVITNPNGGAVQITTASAHGLTSGATVLLQGITGQAQLNATWVITVTSTTQFTLGGVLGNGVSSSSGKVYVSTVVAFAADTAGTAGTSAVGTITQLVTSLVGVSCSNTAALVGAGWESNAALVARCRLKLQSLSPNAPAGAYQYFALTASQLVQAFTTADATAQTLTLTSPISRTKVALNLSTGVVTLTLANASGPVGGCANLAVSNASASGGLIKITTSTNHNLSTGNFVQISGVQGVPANGFWTITVSDATNFTLSGSTFSGSYTSGGSVEGSDLGLVDYIVQQNCVPVAVTATTQSATQQSVAIVATVYVPSAQASSYAAAVQTALLNYFATLPIGGLATDGATNVIPINDVIGVLYQAGAVGGSSQSYVRGISNVTLGGGTADLVMGPNNVAVLSPAPSITVVGQ